MKWGDQFPENPLGNVADYLGKEFDLQKSDVMETFSQASKKLQDATNEKPHWIEIALAALIELASLFAKDGKPGSGIAMFSAFQDARLDRKKLARSDADKAFDNLQKLEDREESNRRWEAEQELREATALRTMDTSVRSHRKELRDRYEQDHKKFEAKKTVLQQSYNTAKKQLDRYREKIQKEEGPNQGLNTPEDRAGTMEAAFDMNSAATQIIVLDWQQKILRTAMEVGVEINLEDARRVAFWAHRSMGASMWLEHNKGIKKIDPKGHFTYPSDFNDRFIVGEETRTVPNSNLTIKRMHIGITIKGIKELENAVANLKSIASRKEYQIMLNNGETVSFLQPQVHQAEAILKEFLALVDPKKKQRKKRSDLLKRVTK